ncbi:MAG: PQQ-dependent sugar dehydrogenase [Bryobacterales bacterium]|nr:PQQ-dependent sugar dehydrogenase [Bryobacterales bacterium]
MRALGTLFALATLAAAQTSPIRLAQVASGLTQPTDIQSDGTGRLFILEQPGRIRLLGSSAPFLSIESRVRSGGERGLLGLAFPPDFARKQHFYVNYTRVPDGATVISRFRVQAGNPAAADPASETVILTIPQPFSNHNGGQIVFGPDGYLWIGTGDGGSGNDPLGSGQDRQSLLGKMLRIDVESDLSGYRIPPDNPFVGNPAYRPEIWALGLRNPWRYSFDRETGGLWIGDVGQNRAEEIHHTPAGIGGGLNYGWAVMEGLQCLRPGCDQTGLDRPVFEYTRGAGISITGGYAYRGRWLPGLRGAYLYGDFGSGRIWALRLDGQNVTNELLLASGMGISTFGEDDDGELYVADHGRGIVFRIASQAPAPRLTSQGVVNAASFVPGLVAGSAASLFGADLAPAGALIAAQAIPLPRALAGVEVRVNGVAAPLYAVANANGLEQVNFQVPFEVAGAESVEIRVVREGLESEAVRAPLLAVQPGVFSADGVSVLAVHPDNALVTAERPVEPGGRFYLYAAGLGAVEGTTPATGAASPSEPPARARTQPTANVGGVAAEVEFAGLAPGFVGVYQVNVRLAAGTPSGMPELILTSGESASPPLRLPVGR